MADYRGMMHFDKDEKTREKKVRETHHSEKVQTRMDVRLPLLTSNECRSNVAMVEQPAHVTLV